MSESVVFRRCERATAPVRFWTVLDPVPEVVATLDGLLARTQRGVSVVPPKLRSLVLCEDGCQYARP